MLNMILIIVLCVSWFILLPVLFFNATKKIKKDAVARHYDLDSTMTVKWIDVDEAANGYRSGRIGNYFLPHWIEHGFYMKALTFTDWLDYYKINIY